MGEKMANWTRSKQGGEWGAVLTGVDLGADELERDVQADHVPERVEVAGERLLLSSS